MTNQEAIKWLNEAEILDLTRGNTKDRQAINAAISALAKQIPKKPTLHEGWLYCSVCKKDILMEGYKFCPDCGQRIEWMDDET